MDGSKMKSDSFDMTYTTGGMVAKESHQVFNDYKHIEKIEVLIKALGTMVIINESVINPTTLKKEHLGVVQQPILLDGHREQALGKLIELISKL